MIGVGKDDVKQAFSIRVDRGGSGCPISQNHSSIGNSC